MQLLYEASEESPGERGLGVLPGMVRLLPEGVKRPQMQWNRLDLVAADHPLFAGLRARPWMYFVHSYAPDDRANAIATCDYGGEVVAAVGQGERVGHPVPPREVRHQRPAAPVATSSRPAPVSGLRGRPTSSRPRRTGSAEWRPASRSIRPSTCATGAACASTRATTPGRPSTATTPPAQARRFAAAGAAWVHVVDLDAARSGEPRNRPVVAAVAAALPVGVGVQCGGGVRSVEAADALFAAGVRRVVVGTAALEQPGLVAELAGRRGGDQGGDRGGEVAVGLDVRGRDVALRGWEQGSGLDVAEALARFERLAVAAYVVTQIAVDGTLEGPDLALYRALLALTPTPVVASGGVGSLAHIAALRDLEERGQRLAGVIVGRALYDGAFTLEEALDVAASPPGATPGRTTDS